MCSSVVAGCYASDYLAQSQAAGPLHDKKFDLNEQTFKAIFQNINPCKHSKINSISFNNQPSRALVFILRHYTFPPEKL